MASRSAIDNPPFMPLCIEAVNNSGLCGLPAFQLRITANKGDAVRGPEVLFELGLAGGAHLNPFYWHNDYDGVRTGRTANRTRFRPSTLPLGYRRTFTCPFADAPFDREDSNLNPAAGACITCPVAAAITEASSVTCRATSIGRTRLSRQVEAHIDRELAARPSLVQIEYSWRPASQQRPGTLKRDALRELHTPDNPDAEPSCDATRTAIVVFGKHRHHAHRLHRPAMPGAQSGSRVSVNRKRQQRPSRTRSLNRS